MPHQKLATEPTVRETGSVVPGLPHASQSIQWKELFTIYLACAVWGHNWPSKKLIFNNDNSSNVAIWPAQSSKLKELMDLA